MKILILRFSSIGDIVLTTPVVRCLKTQLHGAVVHYCTKDSFRPILEANPYIDKCHFLKEDVLELTEELKSEKFDLIVDLHKNLRTYRIKSNLKTPSKSYNKLNIEKWLLVNFKIDRMPAIHIVDRYMATVEHLAVNYDGAGLDYFIPEKDNYSISNQHKTFKNGFVVFAIGGQHETKKLPIAKMIELASKIRKPIVLVGGKEDAVNGDVLANKDSNRILNLCGKLNLNQSASVIQQSEKVYTHDTGMMHVASAFRKEVICIWGNTVPEFGMYPFQTKHTNLEVQGLRCRPCSKIGFDKCPKEHFNCMNLQEFTEEII